MMADGRLGKIDRGISVIEVKKMQVSVETTEGLGRRMTVQVPAERVEQEVDKRLQSLTRTVKLAGFRPGRVPLKVLEKKYGGRVREEVVADVIGNSLSRAMLDNKLRPAGRPHIDTKTAEVGKDLEYEAVFDVYPEIELASLEGVQIDKPTVEITDADMDKMFDKLRSQRAEWKAVERAAENGDQLVIGFVGTVDGEEFAGGTADKVPLTLGSKMMIPGFEDQLIGVSAGDERTIKVTFPEDYQAKELAGKDAEFKVTVQSVSEQVLPELDDTFAEAFGIAEGGMEALRSEVRANMERELKAKVAAKLKAQIMDVLLEKNEVALPQALVDQEIDAMMEQSGLRMADTAKMKDPGVVRTLFEEQAKKRVALGLILAEVSGKNKIRLDPDKLREKVENMAMTYEDPEAFMKWASSDATARTQLESLAMEEQVVDWLLEQVEINEVATSFDEIMNPQASAEG